MNVPRFDPKNKTHRKLVALSKQAHIDYANSEVMAQIDQELDLAYYALLKAQSAALAGDKVIEEKEVA